MLPNLPAPLATPVQLTTTMPWSPLLNVPRCVPKSPGSLALGMQRRNVASVPTTNSALLAARPERAELPITDSWSLAQGRRWALVARKAKELAAANGVATGRLAELPAAARVKAVLPCRRLARQAPTLGGHCRASPRSPRLGFNVRLLSCGTAARAELHHRLEAVARPFFARFHPASLGLPPLARKWRRRWRSICGCRRHCLWLRRP